MSRWRSVARSYNVNQATISGLPLAVSSRANHSDRTGLMMDQLPQPPPLTPEDRDYLRLVRTATLAQSLLSSTGTTIRANIGIGHALIEFRRTALHAAVVRGHGWWWRRISHCPLNARDLAGASGIQFE